MTTDLPGGLTMTGNKILDADGNELWPDGDCPCEPTEIGLQGSELLVQFNPKPECPTHGKYA